MKLNLLKLKNLAPGAAVIMHVLNFKYKSGLWKTLGITVSNVSVVPVLPTGFGEIVN